MLRRYIKIGLLAVALAAQATICCAEDIKIGAALIFSGWAAGYGEDAKEGIDLAVEQINAKGGLLSRNVQVVYSDTGADRAKAVALYQEYGSEPDLAGMLSISSIEFLALDPVGPQVKLPLVSIGSASPYTNFSPWSFRVQLIVDKAMPFVLGQLKKLRHAERIGVIYDVQNNYTVSEMEAVDKAAQATAMSVVGTESFRTGDQDFTLQLTQLMANKPDVLYVAATTNEASLIISQAKALGIDAQIVGGAGLNDARIATLPDQAAIGAMTFFPFDPSALDPAVQEFVQGFHKKYGSKAPPAYAALGYDATLLLADAVRRAKSTDHEQIREALGNTRDLPLANGRFEYHGSGDNVLQAPKLFEYTASGLKAVTP